VYGFRVPTIHKWYTGGPEAFRDFHSLEPEVLLQLHLKNYI